MNYPIDFKMKKEPKQARSKATVDAIIQACAHILGQQGYSALNTNEVARIAGVSIGSVYEFFPGKEAIVATMVQSMLDSHLQKLHGELSSRHDNDFNKAMRYWIGTLYKLVLENKRMLQVMLFEVPYSSKLVSADKLQMALFQVVMKGAARSREQYQVSTKPEVLFLISSSTIGTLLSLAFSPPTGLDSEKVLDQLSEKITGWLVE